MPRGTERAWCPGGIVAGAEWGQSGRRGREGQVAVRWGWEKELCVRLSPTPKSLCLRCPLPPLPTWTVATFLHVPGSPLWLGGSPFRKGCLSSQCASFWYSLGSSRGCVSSARWTGTEEVFFSICWLCAVARGRGRRCWVRNPGPASKVQNGLQRRRVLPLGEHHGQRAGPLPKLMLCHSAPET